MKISHIALLFLLSLSLSCSHHAEPKSVAQVVASNHKVLLVFAHPDDETIMGSFLIYLHEQNIPVHAIYATNGSGGKHLAKPGISSEEMGKVREAELESAAKCYGFEKKTLIGLKDAPFRDANGTPIRDADVFLKSKAWDINILRSAIEKETSEFQPDILITMGLGENTHAHHQSVRIITEKLLNEKKPTSIQYAFSMESSKNNRIEFNTRTPSKNSTTFADVANHCAHFHESQSAGHGSPFYGYETLSMFYASAQIPTKIFGLNVIRK